MSVQNHNLCEQRIKELEAQLADKQFRIDSLMLEFCPKEMSKEQLDNWGKHQVRASPEQEAAADAAMKGK